MSGYLLMIIGTVLLCAVLTALAPSGKTSSVIKGIARLVCVLVIVAPVLRFFQTGEIPENSTGNVTAFLPQTGIEADEEFIKYYCELRIRDAEAALEEEIYDKYAVSAKVNLEWEKEKENVYGIYETEKIRIIQIRVVLKSAIEEEFVSAISKYLKENYCSEVVIE